MTHHIVIFDLIVLGYIQSPLLTINITSPVNNTQSNETLVVQYKVTDNDNTTLSCSLYIDNALNMTNGSVQNDTMSSF